MNNEFYLQQEPNPFTEPTEPTIPEPPPKPAALNATFPSKATIDPVSALMLVPASWASITFLDFSRSCAMQCSLT